jgi:hypothetical protein
VEAETAVRIGTKVRGETAVRRGTAVGVETLVRLQTATGAETAEAAVRVDGVVQVHTHAPAIGSAGGPGRTVAGESTV